MITLGQFVPVHQTIERLTEVRGLPAAVSLRLARYWRTLRPELDTYERERVRLIYELGTQHGEEVRVNPENEASFNEQIAAMQGQELDLKIKPFDMIDLQRAELTVAEILALEQAGLLTVNWGELDDA